MKEAFSSLDPVLQAALAGGFTWSVTALGAALVFFVRRLWPGFAAMMVLDVALG